MMLRASFMGKNQKISNTYKTEKGAIMKEGKRNQLDAKLKKMLNHPFSAVLNPHAFQMAHEVVTAAAWAVFIFNHLVAAIAEVISDLIGQFFQISV